MGEVEGGRGCACVRGKVKGKLVCRMVKGVLRCCEGGWSCDAGAEEVLRECQCWNALRL